jgi:hypothetical protein
MLLRLHGPALHWTVMDLSASTGERPLPDVSVDAGTSPM